MAATRDRSATAGWCGTDRFGRRPQVDRDHAREELGVLFHHVLGVEPVPGTHFGGGKRARVVICPGADTCDLKRADSSPLGLIDVGVGIVDEEDAPVALGDEVLKEVVLGFAMAADRRFPIQVLKPILVLPNHLAEVIPKTQDLERPVDLRLDAVAENVQVRPNVPAAQVVEHLMER